MEISYYQKMRNIERLSGHYKHRQYNLMEHSYMVAVLFSHFAVLEDVSYDIKTIDNILHHDILETVTGDLVSPVKYASEITAECWETIESELLKIHFQLDKYSDSKFKESFNELQHQLFKSCDYLDLWIFCKEEVELGNHTKGILEVIKNCERLIGGRFKWIVKYMSEYGK